jgi:hypothetical protein
MMRACSAVMLGIAHATVAADRHAPKVLATARWRVHDVAGNVDVVTIVARVRFRLARRQDKRQHRHGRADRSHETLPQCAQALRSGQGRTAVRPDRSVFVSRLASSATRPLVSRRRRSHLNMLLTMLLSLPDAQHHMTEGHPHVFCFSSNWPTRACPRMTLLRHRTPPWAQIAPQTAKRLRFVPCPS